MHLPNHWYLSQNYNSADLKVKWVTVNTPSEVDSRGWNIIPIDPKTGFSFSCMSSFPTMIFFKLLFFVKFVNYWLYFCLNRSLVYGNPYYISIIYRFAKRNFVLSLILLVIQKRKNRQMLCQSRAFRVCCISEIIKDRTKFLFANR